MSMRKFSDEADLGRAGPKCVLHQLRGWVLDCIDPRDLNSKHSGLSVS